MIAFTRVTAYPLQLLPNSSVARRSLSLPKHTEHRHACLCAQRSFSLLYCYMNKTGRNACLAHRLGSPCSVAHEPRQSLTPSTLHNLWKGRRSAKPAKIAILVCDRTQRDTRRNLQGRRHVSRYKHLNHPWRNAEILSLASILASAPIKRCC